MAAPRPTPELPEHYFRHEFGRLVAVLSRRFGVQQIALCEDAAQTALLRAVQAWGRSGMPEDPGAWLYRVAKNHALDLLRREQRTAQLGREQLHESEPAQRDGKDEVFLEREVRDDQLRLLFVCADPTIPRPAQLVLALKVLCGFSTGEIALRLFSSEEAVHKRLQRARATLQTQALDCGTPVEQLAARLPSVLQMLYLLFNEGYSSAQSDALIRGELCEEAVRLALLLVEHPGLVSPELNALLALMYLHAARFEARVDGAGGLLPLEQQDRTLWDQELLRLGLFYLERAARGEHFSRYHVEAAIAAEHCLAPSYEQTRWSEIARLYVALERLAPSPLNLLNRAIALAEWQGPAAGLAMLEPFSPPGWLRSYYLWDATLGELYRRCGQLDRARNYLQRALESAPTAAERELLRRRLAGCEPEG